MKRISFMSQGWTTWGLAILVMWFLPGSRWKTAPPPGFPWAILLPTALLMLVLILAGAILAWLLGPRAARSRSVAVVMAPPEIVWGALVLAIWPAAWGPPGLGAWAAAFLATAVPGELRWLAQALPNEHPLPEAYGQRAILLSRRDALVHIVPRWVAVRLPLWITATLVLERMLGIAGLGSDWMARIATRDRWGMAGWLILLAGLWTVAQWRERSRT